MSKLVLEEENMPKGWTIASIGSIGKLIHYGYTATSTKKNTGIRYLRITDIQKGNVVWDDVPFCNVPAGKKPNFLLHENDIVFARTGGTVGKSFLIKENVPTAIFASYLIRVILTKHTDPQFIHFFFQSHNYWNQIQKGKTGLKTNVNAQILSTLVFKLPPLKEQKRIVEKIKEFFLTLDHTKIILENIKLQLNQYRESLLKSAFRGMITEKWRDCNDSNEDVSIILEKIKGSQSKMGRKIQKNAVFDSFKKYKLPKNWIWSNIYSIAKDLGDSPFGTNLKSKDYVDSGIPVIHGRNIKNNKFYWKYPLYVTKKKFDSLERSHCHPNDIIFQKIGSVGIVAILPIIGNQKSFLLSTNCMKVSTDEKFVSIKFIFYYFSQQIIKRFIEYNAQGTSQPIFNFTTLKSFPIPIMSSEEQQEIVSQIEQGFSLIENIENIINSKIAQLNTLRSIILKQAFEGKLVPQDPNDEPAEILLQRIKQEKEQYKEKIKQEKEQLIQKQKASRSTKNVK